jgi:hypothetical protein
MSDRKSYKALIGSQEDVPAFLIASGTSLLGTINNESLWEEICGNICLAINSSIVAMAWGEGEHDRRYWVSTDKTVMGWSYWENIKKAKAHRVVRSYYPDLKGFYYFEPRPTYEERMNYDDYGLLSSSSTMSALDLAIQIGCRPIFLLGLDHYITQARRYFWQFMDEKPKMISGTRRSEKQEKAEFMKSVKMYKELKKFGDSRNTFIGNCNPNSKLDVFDKMTPENALAMINDN